jgi:hypothetical protein
VKRNVYLTLTLVGLLYGAALVFTNGAQTASSEKHAFTPDAIPYGPAPAFVVPGAQLAVLEGNPGAPSGDYTVRLKMPDGYRIAPHWHPQRENVTIISGTFKVGMGDRFEESKMGASRPIVSLISTLTCITMRWPAEKWWSKSTAHLS